MLWQPGKCFSPFEALKWYGCILWHLSVCLQILSKKAFQKAKIALEFYRFYSTALSKFEPFQKEMAGIMLKESTVFSKRRRVTPCCTPGPAPSHSSTHSAHFCSGVSKGAEATSSLKFIFVWARMYWSTVTLWVRWHCYKIEWWLSGFRDCILAL